MDSRRTAPRLALALALALALPALAQDRGCFTGPFLKVADLWLVYIRPALTLQGGRLWVPAHPLAALAGLEFKAEPQSLRLAFRGRRAEFPLTRVEEGRAMVPLRDVAQALGLTLRWDRVHRVAYLDGPGLARDPYAPFPSLRFRLFEHFRGFDPTYPEVQGPVPLRICWRWQRGLPQRGPNPERVDLVRGSGFRLTWAWTRPPEPGTLFVLGVAHDDRLLFPPGINPGGPTQGYGVRGYGRYGFPYHHPTEGQGERVPDDREYCRPQGQRVVCEAGPILYSEPYAYPDSVPVYVGPEVVSRPRLVFVRVYRW